MSMNAIDDNKIFKDNLFRRYFNMADENKTFDEYINNLRQICIEQRKLLGLSQKKVWK